MEHPSNGPEFSQGSLDKAQPTELDASDTSKAPAREFQRSPDNERTQSLTTSLRLFFHARRGDLRALDKLFARLLPSVQRWARGRLPMWARRRLDTADLVQEAFVHLFRRLGHLEPRRNRALRAYLQESIRNRIRDEIRRAGLVETSGQPSSEWPDRGTSPLERAIAVENATRYREALSRLEPSEQELIVGRIEMGLSYEQLALASGRPSADAARVAVRRALLKLAKEISPA